MEENENENNKEKKYLFSFAKINKYFIFPFLCPIFCMICNFFIEKINNDEGLKNKECFLAIIECTTFIGGGLLYFISSLREKTEETRDNAREYAERRTSIRLIYNDSNIKPTRQIIIIFKFIIYKLNINIFILFYFILLYE